MNSNVKLIAAAKRAARKISHVDGIPYQIALEQVARTAGHGTWSTFLSNPVPIDRAADMAGREPDFTRTSPDAHLDAALDYGVLLGARALLASQETEDTPARLVYCSNRSNEYDHPVDARGISVASMVAVLATSTMAGGNLASIQDGTFGFEVDHINGLPQLRLSLDEKMPPVAPLHVEADGVGMVVDRRAQALEDRKQAVLRASPIPKDTNGFESFWMLVELAWRTHRADLVFEPYGSTVDAVLTVDDARRIVHVLSAYEYRMLVAVAKDVGRCDQMEYRFPEYGDFHCTFDVDNENVPVYTAHLPGDGAASYDAQKLYVGFTPFARRTYAMLPTQTYPQGGRIPLGEQGFFNRTSAYSKENALIMISGRPGSGRTTQFVIPAILDGDGADVIVSDMTGRTAAMLQEARTWGDAWMQLDPRTARTRRSPAFNPLHPDMMPAGHMIAADWIAETLIPGSDELGDMARLLLSAIIDMVVAHPQQRVDPETVEDIPTLTMVAEWASTNCSSIERIKSTMNGSLPAHAAVRFEQFLSIERSTQTMVLSTLERGLSFISTPGMREILSPANEDSGAALARALMIRQSRSMIVVGGDADQGQGRLCALVMQAARHLRSRTALRETHFYVDDAIRIGPMPWLEKAVSNEYGMPFSSTAVVVLDAPSDLDVLCPAAAGARAVGIDHWIIEEVSDVEEQARIADAMGVPRFRITSHRADSRRLEVAEGSVRMLRR